MTAENLHARTRLQLTTHGLLVVLPALNEEESVAQVIDEVRGAQPGAAILVVDDGSSDRTAEFARGAGAMVMRLPFNLGVGGAMRAAYRYGHEHGYQLVVQVDADGQHDPGEIAVLLEAANGADVVVGARFAGRGSYQVRGPRRWAMRFLALILSRILRTPLSDPTSGFRLANARATAFFAEQYPEEYLGDTVEALVVAHRAGLRIVQVPVAMRARDAGVASHNPARAAIYLARAMAAVGLALMRRRPQLSDGR